MTTEEAKQTLHNLKEKYYSPTGEALIPLIKQAQSTLGVEVAAAEDRAQDLITKYQAGEEGVYDKMQEAITKREALYDLFLI